MLKKLISMTILLLTFMFFGCAQNSPPVCTFEVERLSISHDLTSLTTQTIGDEIATVVPSRSTAIVVPGLKTTTDDMEIQSYTVDPGAYIVKVWTSDERKLISTFQTEVEQNEGVIVKITCQ